MLFYNTLLGFPLLASFAQALCWKNGAKANQEMAKVAVKDVATLMQGYFRDSQMRYSCLSDFPSGNSYIFTIQRMPGKGDDWLDIVKINDWLFKEASACEYGGHSEYDDGKWGVNVNAVPGTCIDMVYLNGHPETLPPK